MGTTHMSTTYDDLVKFAEDHAMREINVVSTWRCGAGVVV